MSETELSDEERLAEVGRILAAGAMRMLSKKTNSAAKSRLAGGRKTGLIVSGGEKFETKKSSSKEVA